MFRQTLLDGGGEPALPGAFVMALRARPDDRVLWLAVLEEDHRGDREHVVAGGGRGAVVHVQLREDDAVSMLARQVVEDGADDTAWATPRCPEVDDHGTIRLQDFALERRVCDFLDHGLTIATLKDGSGALAHAARAPSSLPRRRFRRSFSNGPPAVRRTRLEPRRRGPPRGAREMSSRSERRSPSS